jgi:hypothetical protein
MGSCARAKAKTRRIEHSVATESRQKRERSERVAGLADVSKGRGAEDESRNIASPPLGVLFPSIFRLAIASVYGFGGSSTVKLIQPIIISSQV